MPETLSSQGSIHSGWNLWLQGRTRTSWPLAKSSVQTEQARPWSAFASGLEDDFAPVADSVVTRSLPFPADS